MEKTPLERACIAVIDNLREQGDLMPDCGDPEWAQVDGAFRVEPVVRAVLTAIREPSEGMVAALPGDHEREVYIADWQAMIDAVLAEALP